MKNKTLTILLIGVLVLSCLSISTGKLVKCPDCVGTGEIDCPTCSGTGTTEATGEVPCDRCSGTGTLTPKIQRTDMTVEQKDGKTIVNGTFRNNMDFDVDGTVTADLAGHSNSMDVTFPAGEDLTVSVEIPYTGSYQGIRLIQNTRISVEGIQDMTCPFCDGTGFVAEGADCLDCDGTGTIECQTCNGVGRVDEAVLAQQANGGIPWITIEIAVAAVAVIGVVLVLFIVFKKRRVNERTLRRLSSRQFNEWVLKRLDGKTATSRDSAISIDGYTASGYPVLIKQADDVGMPEIDRFAAALARNKTRNGVIVAYSYGSDAIRGKVRAQMNYRLQIEMLTLSELIESKRTF